MWTRSWLKMAWDWQLPVAETANLPSCSLSVVWKKTSWRPLECCPWLSCQRHSGHQANSCWTGAENRVNHNPWFMSGIHRGWCQAFFTFLLFLSICSFPLLPLAPPFLLLIPRQTFQCAWCYLVICARDTLQYCFGTQVCGCQSKWTANSNVCFGDGSGPL